MKPTGKAVLLGWILAAGLVIALLVASAAARRPGQAADASIAVEVRQLGEASGLAPSRRTADVLWSHNDSGGEPVLYGFGPDGALKATLRIAGTKNDDWEAVASFDLDGRSWIAIGAFGDNSASHAVSTIHVVEEPGSDRLSPSVETVVPIAWSVRFRYEDGPRDAECMVADPAQRQFILVSKRFRPPGVYALPMQLPPGRKLGQARRVASVLHLPAPSSLQRLFPTPTGRYRGQPTDAALSEDGRTLAILTYAEVLLYRREAEEAWRTALAREPVHLAAHGLPQAEGLCFAFDQRSIYVIGEQRPAKLLRYELR